jgi:hypothetical protein
MAKEKQEKKEEVKTKVLLRGMTHLWDLQIEEITGRNLEAKGREDVNQMLKDGWVLLHVYTLKYEEDGVWRERPMAILGKPNHPLAG